MKNFISAGEAIRDSSNPFMAFLDSETASPNRDAELSAFHDPVNKLTLVTNQKTVFSPQTGEAMQMISGTSTRMDEATRKELASTCTLMGCAKCGRRALVENELSFTLAGEEMACPVCGADTTFNYVDDGEALESATAFATLADIQGYTFTGDDDADAGAYDAIEQFILGDASMDDKIAALGVMMRSMGVEETPTQADVEQFISEANSFDPDADDSDEDEDSDEFASFKSPFAVRFIAAKYELADTMTGLDDDEDPMNPHKKPTNADVAPVAEVNAESDVTTTTDVVDPAADTTIAPVTTDDITPATSEIETLTDADTNTYVPTDADDALAGGGDATLGGETVDGDPATVTLDDTLESLDTPFGEEPFADEEETTVTVASMIDLSRPLSFAKLSDTEIAVFVGSNHIGSLRREASAETAAALYTNGRIQTAFAAAFNANRNAVETAAELRGFGFRPVQFRINLGEVATARVAAARETAEAGVATRAAKAINRHSKLVNLTLLGVCKNHFKVRTGLFNELASMMERAGVRNAQHEVRKVFAEKGPEFFSQVVRTAGELANKSDEHLNGISEAIADKEYVGADAPAETTPAPVKSVVAAPPATGETASFADRGGNGNSTTGKIDFGHLVRSVSRRH